MLSAGMSGHIHDPPIDDAGSILSNTARNAHGPENTIPLRHFWLHYVLSPESSTFRYVTHRPKGRALSPSGGWNSGMLRVVQKLKDIQLAI